MTAVLSATPFAKSATGLKKKPTYEEVLDYIERDPDKIKYPDRRAKILRSTHWLSQLDGEGWNEFQTQERLFADEQLHQVFQQQVAAAYNIPLSFLNHVTTTLGLRATRKAILDRQYEQQAQPAPAPPEPQQPDPPPRAKAQPKPKAKPNPPPTVLGGLGPNPIPVFPNIGLPKVAPKVKVAPVAEPEGVKIPVPVGQFANPIKKERGVTEIPRQSVAVVHRKRFHVPEVEFDRDMAFKIFKAGGKALYVNAKGTVYSMNLLGSKETFEFAGDIGPELLEGLEVLGGAVGTGLKTSAKVGFALGKFGWRRAVNVEEFIEWLSDLRSSARNEPLAIRESPGEATAGADPEDVGKAEEQATPDPVTKPDTSDIVYVKRSSGKSGSSNSKASKSFFGLFATGEQDEAKAEIEFEAEADAFEKAKRRLEKRQGIKDALNQYLSSHTSENDRIAAMIEESIKKPSLFSESSSSSSNLVLGFDGVWR